MVRMRGMVSISVPFGSPDVANRLTHRDTPGVRSTGKRQTACRRTIVSGTPSEDFGVQPAFCCNQAYGSTTEPLMCTSKWRWLSVELPVEPTRPMSWPAATVWPAWTCRLPYVM